MPAELLDVIRLNALDQMDEAFSFSQAVDLTRPGLGHRTYFKLDLKDAQGRPCVMYMKRYEREPLSWRIKRLLTYGWHKSPASVEVACVRGASQAGVPAIDHAYANEESDLLGVKRSYVILSAVAGEAIEHCGQDFIDRHADRPEALGRLTDALAELAATLHGSGYVHRDLYTSHIYIEQAGEELHLRLIDLARMFRPRRRLFRWRVKDLAQLKYSMPPQWTEQYWSRFMDGYLQRLAPPRAGRYHRAVARKEQRMRRKLDARRRRERE